MSLRDDVGVYLSEGISQYRFDPQSFLLSASGTCHDGYGPSRDSPGDGTSANDVPGMPLPGSAPSEKPDLCYPAC